MDPKPISELEIEAKKQEIQIKTQKLINDGKSPFTNIGETIGINDPIELAIVEELAILEFENNKLMLADASSPGEDLRTNYATRQALTRVLSKIGRTAYSEYVRTIAAMDFSHQNDLRQDAKRRNEQLRQSDPKR